MVGDKTAGRWPGKSQHVAGRLFGFWWWRIVWQRITSSFCPPSSFLHLGAALWAALANRLWAEVVAVTPRLKWTTGTLISPFSVSQPLSVSLSPCGRPRSHRLRRQSHQHLATQKKLILELPQTTVDFAWVINKLPFGLATRIGAYSNLLPPDWYREPLGHYKMGLTRLERLTGKKLWLIILENYELNIYWHLQGTRPL